jgi:hypothetical protein
VTWRDGFALSHHDAPSTCDNVPSRFVQIHDRGRIQPVDRPVTVGRLQ